MPPRRSQRCRSSWPACGSDDSKTTSGGSQGSPAAVDEALQKGGTITYWSWTPSAQAQVAAFEKAYPNVKVNYVNAGTGNDHYTKLQNTIKAGSGAPDVAQIEYQALPQFALPGSLVDLRQYGFDQFQSAYTPSTWAAVHAGGRVCSGCRRTRARWRCSTTRRSSTSTA